MGVGVPPPKCPLVKRPSQPRFSVIPEPVVPAGKRSLLRTLHLQLSTLNCFSPATPIIPAHTDHSPLSPIIPAHTQNRGWGYVNDYIICKSRNCGRADIPALAREKNTATARVAREHRKKERQKAPASEGGLYKTWKQCCVTGGRRQWLRQGFPGCGPRG